MCVFNLYIASYKLYEKYILYEKNPQLGVFTLTICLG